MTINKLNGEKDEIYNKTLEGNNIIETGENDLNSKDSQINQLNDIVLRITNDQKRINQINENMKKQIDNKYEDKKDLLLKEKEFGNHLQKILEENEQLKKILEEKENQIKDLKENIEKVTNALKKGEDISNLNINNLLEEDEEEILKRENNDKEMDLEIKKALEDNIKKDNEINELTKKFEDLIQKKDDEIAKLQIQLGENPLNNNEVEGLESIDLNNNLDLENHEEIDTDILNTENERDYNQNDYFNHEVKIKNNNNLETDDLDGENLNNYYLENNINNNYND